MAKKHVHALKGLACRKRVAAASSPAATCKQGAALTSRLRDTLAAAPGLLAHASVTETRRFCPMGPKLRYTAVNICAQGMFRVCRQVLASNSQNCDAIARSGGIKAVIAAIRKHPDNVALMQVGVC